MLYLFQREIGKGRGCSEDADGAARVGRGAESLSKWLAEELGMLTEIMCDFLLETHQSLHLPKDMKESSS